MRFRVLDCIRGIAAIFVVLYHVEIIGLMDVGHFHGLGIFENSFHLVDFFFVLSGFVISYAGLGRIGNREEWLSFMIRRVGRIYPVHIMMLGAFVALECYRFWRMQHGAAPDASVPTPFTGWTSWQSIAPNLLLIQALGMFSTPTWNTPSWSLSCEFYTYVAFACFALWARSWRLVTVAAACVLAAACGLTVLAYAPHYMFSMSDYGFFRCMYGFFIGCLAHAALPYVAKIWIDKRVFNTALEILVLGGALAFVCTTGEVPLSVISPLIFFVVVLTFAREAGLLSRLLVNRPFEYLGEISFTIYLIHAFLLTVTNLVYYYLLAHNILPARIVPITSLHGVAVKLITFASPWLADINAIGLVLVSIGASWVVQRTVENPGRRFFNRLAKPTVSARPQLTLDQPAATSLARATPRG